MKIAMAQLNYMIGDIDGNTQKIIDVINKKSGDSDLIVFSELAVTGYYPQDLIERQSFIEKQDIALEKIRVATEANNIAICIGAITKNAGVGKAYYNSALVIDSGVFIYQYNKQLLPTYNIFDERRHFAPGNQTGVFTLKGKRIGILICEDVWHSSEKGLYQNDPVDNLSRSAVDMVISLNASPSNIGKWKERKSLIKAISTRLRCPVLYVNQVGGNDDLVFDGRSFAVNWSGAMTTLAKAFEEDVVIYDSESNKPLNETRCSIDQSCYMDDMSITALLYQQAVMGIRDYVEKLDFKGIVFGSSGGIDSAVVGALATAALGSDRVKAITMPSIYSSEGSVSDSVSLCNALSVQLFTREIGDEFKNTVAQYETSFGNVPSNLTQENMQARIRGRVLMEYSNDTGMLVLSTGNKSEMSVGYATLYGDMNGGINPLGDIYKIQVYELARYINEINGKEIIPATIIEKEPSAELSEDQKDADSLPPYPILDTILRLYIEGDLMSEWERKSFEGFLKSEQVEEVVQAKVRTLVDRAEFKRRQAPPIIRMQRRAFGFGRQLPIAAKYD